MDKTENKMMVCFLVTFAVLNLIGYLGNVDMLKTFVVEPGSRSIHFVSVVVSVAVAAIYGFLAGRTEKRHKS